MNIHLIFDIILIVLLLSFASVRLFFGIKVQKSGENYFASNKDAIKREGAFSYLARIVLFLFLVIVVGYFLVNTGKTKLLDSGFPDWLRWIGVFGGVLSIPLLIWVQKALGKFWSTDLELRKDHSLITGGPYQRVRHPMYSVIFLMLISCSMVASNWIFIFGSLTAISIIYSRIGKEEKMMLEKFGEDYQAFILQTGKLFPKL